MSADEPRWGGSSGGERVGGGRSDSERVHGFLSEQPEWLQRDPRVEEWRRKLTPAEFELAIVRARFYPAMPTTAVFAFPWVALGLFAVAGGLFYAANRVSGPLDRIADSIEKASKAIEEVKTHVLRLIDQISEVITIIQRLPEELRGVLDEATLRTHLKYLHGLSFGFEEMLRSTSAFERAEETGQAQGNIQHLFNYVSVVESIAGRAYFLQVAPSLATWQIVQRALAKLKPDVYRAPPSHAFQKYHAPRVLEFIRDAGEKVESYRWRRDEVPVPDQVYEFAGGRFRRIEFPYRGEYLPNEDPAPQANLFSAALDLPSTGPRAALLSLAEPRPHPSPRPRPWVWQRTEGAESGPADPSHSFPDRETVITAQRAFEPVARGAGDMALHLQIFDREGKWEEYRDAIVAAFQLETG